MRPVLLASLLLLPACLSGDGLSDKLRDATRGYNSALRWGDIDRAAEFLPATSQDVFMITQDEAREDLVIVEYDVTRLDLDHERGVAASRALITWHTEKMLIVKETIVDQLWQFHDGDFVLVDERHAGGDPLPIFAEVEEVPHPYLPGLEAFREANEIGKENKGRKRSRRRARQEQARR
jgi:hypothetical protein